MSSDVDTLLAEIAGATGIDLEAEGSPGDLIIHLGVDSLSLAMIADVIEAETGSEVSDDLVGSWRTVGDVMACIRGRSRSAD